MYPFNKDIKEQTKPLPLLLFNNKFLILNEKTQLRSPHGGAGSGGSWVPSSHSQRCFPPASRFSVPFTMRSLLWTGNLSPVISHFLITTEKYLSSFLLNYSCNEVILRQEQQFSSTSCFNWNVSGRQTSLEHQNGFLKTQDGNCFSSHMWYHHRQGKKNPPLPLQTLS